MAGVVFMFGVEEQGRLSRTCMGKEHPGRSSVSLASWWNGANHHYGLLLVGRHSPISIEGRREEGGSRGTGKNKRSVKIRVAGRLAGVEGSKNKNELRFEKEEKRTNQVKYLGYYSDG